MRAPTYIRSHIGAEGHDHSKLCLLSVSFVMHLLIGHCRHAAGGGVSCLRSEIWTRGSGKCVYAVFMSNLVTLTSQLPSTPHQLGYPNRIRSRGSLCVRRWSEVELPIICRRL